MFNTDATFLVCQCHCCLMSCFVISAAGDLYTWGWGMLEFDDKLTHNSFDSQRKLCSNISTVQFLMHLKYFKYLQLYFCYHFRWIWPTWTPEFNQFRWTSACGVFPGTPGARCWCRVRDMEHFCCCCQEGSSLLLKTLHTGLWKTCQEM